MWSHSRLYSAYLGRFQVIFNIRISLSLCFIAFRDSEDINVLEYLTRRGEGYNENNQEQGSPRTRITKNEDNQEQGSPRTRITKNKDHQEQGSPRTRITKNEDNQEQGSPRTRFTKNEDNQEL